jgi:hypothetical protein
MVVREIGAINDLTSLTKASLAADAMGKLQNNATLSARRQRNKTVTKRISMQQSRLLRKPTLRQKFWDAPGIWNHIVRPEYRRGLRIARWHKKPYTRECNLRTKPAFHQIGPEHFFNTRLCLRSSTFTVNNQSFITKQIHLHNILYDMQF